MDVHLKPILAIQVRTTRRKNKDGSVVEYFQLASNVRHAETGQPVAEIIHNFGRADELNRDDMVRLCRSIARICGLEVRDPLALPAETSVSSPLCLKTCCSSRLSGWEFPSWPKRSGSGWGLAPPCAR